MNNLEKYRLEIQDEMDETDMNMNHRKDIYYECINNLNIKNKKILDIGGGTGKSIQSLLDNNEVSLLDFSEKKLELADRRFKTVHFDLDSYQNLPFKDKSFDLIVCCQVLEHLINPFFIIKEVYRILKEDGEVLISVPNHFVWWMRKRILLGKGIQWQGHEEVQKIWDYGHLRFFTYQSFIDFINLGKFKIINQIDDKKCIRTPLWIPSYFIKKAPNLFLKEFVFIIKKN